MINNGGDQLVVFAPAVEEKKLPDKKWRVLVVDDEPDIFKVTYTAMHEVVFLDRLVYFEYCDSAEAAKKFMREQDDVALILLDIIMESDGAGFDVIDYVRNELGNKAVQIIIRTGEAKVKDALGVIVNYDIQGFFEKPEITRYRLTSGVICALRNYSKIAHCNELKSKN